MSEDKSQKQSDLERKLVDTIPEQGRRRLLKKSVAIPVIMTLNSGVAAQVARSSNFAGKEADLSNAAGDQDNVFCMNHDGPLPGGAYDLGDSPTYTFVSRNDASGDPRSDTDILGECETNGGIVISSGAFNSISGRINNSDF